MELNSPPKICIPSNAYIKIKSRIKIAKYINDVIDRTMTAIIKFIDFICLRIRAILKTQIVQKIHTDQNALKDVFFPDSPVFKTVISIIERKTIEASR